MKDSQRKAIHAKKKKGMTKTIVKNGITYKRNNDGDWVENMGGGIKKIIPCCDYIDCDFFSTNSKREQYKKEVREHKKTRHGHDTIFVDED